MSFGEQGQQLGMAWNGLSNEQKQIYQDLSTEAKETFGPEDKLRTQKTKPSVTNGKGGGKGSRKIKLAYHIFCAQARLEVTEIHPDASFGDKNKVLGAMWASLDESSKAVYQRAADEQNAAAVAIAEAKNSG